MEEHKKEELYSVNRLKNELRKRPKVDAKPAAWFKNGNNRTHYAVYRLDDCEDLPPKKPHSKKQLAALKKAGIARKLKAFDEQFERLVIESREVRKKFERGFLILDSETTGLYRDDEVIELAIIDHNFNVLHNARYKPTVPIDPGAERVHGISMNDLADRPAISDDYQKIKSILEGKLVAIFNAEFDVEKLSQSFSVHHLDNIKYETFCVMWQSANAFGSTNSYGTISLKNAFRHAGYDEFGGAHTALGDCVATLKVLQSIAQAETDFLVRRQKVEAEFEEWYDSWFKKQERKIEQGDSYTGEEDDDSTPF